MQVFNNICNKQFVVLSSDGKPLIAHKNRWLKVMTDHDGTIIGYKSNTMGPQWTEEKCFDCVHRDSSGLKLMKRIDKMLKRGWTCLNEPCKNPECIMAPTELVSAYNQHLAWERLERLQKKKDEISRQRYIRSYIRDQTWIPDFVSTKTGNWISFESSKLAHKQYQTKKRKAKYAAKTKTCQKFSSKKRRHRSSKSELKRQKYDNIIAA